MKNEETAASVDGALRDAFQAIEAEPVPAALHDLVDALSKSPPSAEDQAA